MKQMLFSLLVFISYYSFSQINHIEMLVGKSDFQVMRYFDSLNHLKSNPYYKIEKKVSNYGDLILENEFSMDDEEFYSCSGIIVRFLRINENEICTEAIVTGHAEFSQRNLNFIKDNFEFSTDNTWEKEYNPNMPFKIVATFKRREEENSSFYVIDYRLVEIK